MARRTPLLVLLLCAAAIEGCNGTPQGPEACRAPQASASAAASLVVDDTSFAVSFYQAVTGAGSANVVVSPYSVSSAMTMVDVGAAGQTDSQIRSALHLPAGGSAIAPAYATVACGAESDGTSDGNRLSIANALWGQRGKAFESSFLSVLSSGYAAPLQQADFEGDPGGAVTAIDAWVSRATEARIPMLLTSADVTRATRLVLVDAVYFAGVWDEGFDPAKTRPAPFTLTDGTVVSVPTMRGAVHLGVGFLPDAGGGSSAGVYELPYKGGALAMDFLLPSTSLASFEAALGAESLKAALAQVRPPGAEQHSVLVLPRFSFGTRLQLAPTLAGMGMTDVFGAGAADLSGMDGARDLHLSAVVHQAQVQVDEQGTVAAASTAATVAVATCTCPSGPQLITIDRPFVFVIRDVRSGLILFMGHVEDPRQGS